MHLSISCFSILEIPASYQGTKGIPCKNKVGVLITNITNIIDAAVNSQCLLNGVI